VPAPDDASGDLPVTGSLVVPAAALSWRFSRSSGPGGQGVNTADSRVELSVTPLELPGLTDAQRARLGQRLAGRLTDDGVLTVAASEHRQQLRNRQAARERLAAVLRAALAPPAPARRRTKPTRGSQERRIAAKKRRGDLKRRRGGWD
jgi:ribosome-associated protein